MSEFPFPRVDEAAWRARVEAAGVSLDALRSITIEGPVIEPLYPAAESAAPAWARTGAWATAQRWPLEPLEITAKALAEADDLELVWIEAEPQLVPRDVRALATILQRVSPRPLFVRTAVPFGADAVLRAAADDAGVALASLKGGLVADPIGELARKGGLAVGIDEAVAGLDALRRSVAAHAPGLRTALACGLAWHDAGASAVDELAAVVATVLATMRAAESASAAAPETLGTLVTRVGLGGDLLVDVAKIRTLRWLLLAIADRAGAPDRGPTIPIHAFSGQRTRARLDVDTNLVRSTIEAFAAAIGGADAIAIAPHDGDLGASARWARNVSHLLRDEAHLAKVADPTAGSGAIEALTESLAQAAWARVQGIENAGGIVAGLRSGELQARVARTARARAEAVADGRGPLVGVSKFVAPVDPARAMTLRDAATTNPAAWVERVDPLVPSILSAAFEKGGAT